MDHRANQLIREKSPYLLQHAYNPVGWYPWSEEAFARARREDRPIFLSIGYSTCHWCHVMALESFEDPEIAAILNRWFVCIKVDREERPDIDQMYMAATQAMTGSGGWPMSVFLLPDGSPFYAGTYFPPESVHGMPGFRDLLEAVHRAWEERRGSLQKTAARMMEALAEGTRMETRSAIRTDAADRCFTLLEQNFDPEFGGFGLEPKFPRPVVFSFLFSYHHSSGVKKALEMALLTLKKVSEGGIHDLLGGGFHRYSVDRRWFVPHFEKMLYDQAQLAHAYLDAYQVTGEEEYAETARKIFGYVLGSMQDPGGGFYSAEDADSDDPYSPGHRGEGAFYLWTEKDIAEKLGVGPAAVLCYCCGVEESGNVRDDPAGEFRDRNILFRACSAGEAAAFFNADLKEVEKSLAASEKKLLEYRSLRKRPLLDDKIITAWNGLMIGALARGSRILDDLDLLKAAENAASFIQERLYDPATGHLMKRFRQEEAGLEGQLCDYAFLTAGLLELYQAAQDPRWLRWAEALTRKQIGLFWTEKGRFFYDSVSDPSLRIRMKGEYDGAEPAGNSVAALNLIRLGRIRGNRRWLELAEKTIGSFARTINRYPPALPLMVTAWQQAATGHVQVVVAGKPGAEDTGRLRRVIDHSYDPARIFLLADGGENQEYLAEKLEILKTSDRLDGKATAYVCRDFTCRMPVTDPEALELKLRGQTAEKGARQPYSVSGTKRSAR